MNLSMIAPILPNTVRKPNSLRYIHSQLSALYRGWHNLLLRNNGFDFFVQPPKVAKMYQFVGFLPLILRLLFIMNNRYMLTRLFGYVNDKLDI